MLGTPPQHGVSFARTPDDVAIDLAGECAVGLGPPRGDDVVDTEKVGEGPNKVLRSGGGEHEEEEVGPAGAEDGFWYFR